jgi:Spy/CpxP family protein refolding chaperone
MKHILLVTGSKIVLLGLTLMLASCAPTTIAAQTIPPTQVASAALDAGGGKMTMEQTLSDQAQLTTIAFDGLAFLTGSLGADLFFPPGKVADYWGFQYLRDNDPSEMGHNTDFLTRASLNMLYILTPAQRAQLATLAKSQVASINDYGYKRFVLMKAFRRLLEGDIPAGTTGLDKTAVMKYSAELYKLDGQMSYDRAKVMGGLLKALDTTQRAYLDKMVGKGMTTWNNVDEPSELRGLGRDEKVAVMTYAGDMFSWYAGSIEADVYFCPERQGIYFGSFYMKDAHAVGNPGYSIGTNITADMGNAFIAALTPTQAQYITSLVELQRADLFKIVDTRRTISTQLRKFIAGQTADSATVLNLSDTYGQLDGEIVYYFATHFAKVGKALTSDQKTKLMALRKQTLGDFTPKGAFLYATEIAIPTTPSTDFLFGNTQETPLPTPRSGKTQPTPQPGNPQSDRIGGRVKTVVGGTILIEDPQGKTTNIVTGLDAKFTANGQASNLASVTAGKSIQVTGQKQNDGSWLATQIEISDTPPAPPQGQQGGQSQPPTRGTPPAKK